MYCRNCGKEIASGSKFCGGCGTPVDSDTQTLARPVAETSRAGKEVAKASAEVERPEAERKPIIGEEEANTDSGKTKGNTRGLLCYLGFWVTGIIFLITEKKDKVIRFHAMQSLVTFGILNIIWGIANNVRWGWVGGLGFGLGGFYGPGYIAGTVIFIVFFVLWWVLWAILMYKAYHNKVYRVPGFAGLADKCLAALDKDK
jgi:uncharacterized membrane protein